MLWLSSRGYYYIIGYFAAAVARKGSLLFSYTSQLHWVTLWYDNEIFWIGVGLIGGVLVGLVALG